MASNLTSKESADGKSAAFEKSSEASLARVKNVYELTFEEILFISVSLKEAIHRANLGPGLTTGWIGFYA